MNVQSHLQRVAAVLVAALLASCQSLPYVSFLKFGPVDKKADLMEEVRDARETQLAAQSAFATTFELFKELISTSDAEALEPLYDRLEGELENCEEDLADFRGQVRAIETQAMDLFGDWTAELDQFANARVRSKSETMLVDTRERYDRLMGAMERAEAGIEPVLLAFQDYVLFFNHNLNPRAIATLEDTYPDLLDDIAALRELIEASVVEADSFLEMVEGRDVRMGAEADGLAPAPAG